MSAQNTMKPAQPQGLRLGGYPVSPNSQIGYIGREKFWREIKASEKLERLRRFVHNLKSENEQLRLQVFKLKKHTHDKEGKAVIVESLEHGYPEGSEYPKGLNNNSEDFYI